MIPEMVSARKAAGKLVAAGMLACLLALGPALGARAQTAETGEPAALSMEIKSLQGAKISDEVDGGRKAIPRRDSKFTQVFDGIEIIVKNTKYDKFVVSLDSKSPYQGPRDKVGKIVGWVDAPVGKGSVGNLNSQNVAEGRHVLYRSAPNEKEVRLVYGEGVEIDHLQCGGEYRRRVVVSVEPI